MEIKGYWSNRLFCQDRCDIEECYLCKPYINERLKKEYKGYTHVLFINGYGANRPRVEKEIESITIGKPKKGWCPDEFLDKEYFVIKFK